VHHPVFLLKKQWVKDWKRLGDAHPNTLQLCKWSAAVLRAASPRCDSLFAIAQNLLRGNIQGLWKRHTPSPGLCLVVSFLLMYWSGDFRETAREAQVAATG